MVLITLAAGSEHLSLPTFAEVLLASGLYMFSCLWINRLNSPIYLKAALLLSNLGLTSLGFACGKFGLGAGLKHSRIPLGVSSVGSILFLIFGVLVDYHRIKEYCYSSLEKKFTEH